MTYKAAVKDNLFLMVENARDLYFIFDHDPIIKFMYEKYLNVSTLLLIRFLEGAFAGKEEKLFEAISPLCAKLCSDWNKYNHLL